MHSNLNADLLGRGKITKYKEHYKGARTTHTPEYARFEVVSGSLFIVDWFCEGAPPGRRVEFLSDHKCPQQL